MRRISARFALSVLRIVLSVAGMGEFLLAGPNLPFTGALLLMLLIGVLELAGVGGAFSADADADVDLDADAGGSPLAWLNAGRLPLLMLLIVFCVAFGLFGLALQKLVQVASGELLPGYLAWPLGLVGGVALTRLGGRALGRVLPRDETTAVSRDSLIGLTGTIVLGEARRGAPAQARVRDGFGQSHYVMVEPAGEAEAFVQGAEVRLTRRLDHIYQAVLLKTPPLLARPETLA